jgi:hypothetical protein
MFDISEVCDSIDITERLAAISRLITDNDKSSVKDGDDEIGKSGRAALATKHPRSRVSRAVEKGETQGFIKISVERTAVAGNIPDRTGYSNSLGRHQHRLRWTARSQRDYRIPYFLQEINPSRGIA